MFMRCAFVHFTLATLLFSVFVKNTTQIDDIISKISNGNEAIPHESAWMVSIQQLDSSSLNFYHICGGSILKPHLVLTAAHCLLEFKFEIGCVQTGRHNLTDIELSTEQSRNFSDSNIVIHEGYIYGISPNDIGLIKLNDPLILTSYVKTITLPLANSIANGSVQLYGWGRTSNETSGGVLMTAFTEIIDNKLCNLYFGSEVLATNICTYSENISACSGDSGGPVVKRNDNGADVAVGIVSWGFTICGRPPTVHTRVSAFVDWILVNTSERVLINYQLSLSVFINLLFLRGYNLI